MLRIAIISLIVAFASVFPTTPVHAQGADAPKTTAAPPKVDRRNPAAVAKAFAAAISRGDTATAKSLATAQKDTLKKMMDYLDAWSAEIKAAAAYDKALGAKFGKAADPVLMKKEQIGALAAKGILDEELEPEDEEATFVFQHGPLQHAWELNKRNGQWSVNLDHLQDETDIEPEDLRKQATKLDQLAKDVAAGKHKTAADADKAAKALYAAGE
jgi:hypothetical protein